MLSTIKNFEIRQIDPINPPSEIFSFCEQANAEGMKNNASLDAMKFGRWGTEAWWTTWVDNKIVSISGAHKFDDYEKNCWRLMVRTATLKQYRGRAPGSVRLIHTDFNWGHILPCQIKYAKALGAEKIVFTTNSDSNGDANSLRTNRVVGKVLEPQGLVKLIDTDVTIYYTKQNVWQIIC